MPNMYEYRLRQIEILLRAYNSEDPERYKSEIEELEDERNSILADIKYTEQ